MQPSAMFQGKLYTFVEKIPAIIEGQDSTVLCENIDGHRFACAESEWHAAELQPQRSVQDKIDLFLSMFKGRPDVYARRYENPKTGKNGYKPACENEWAKDLCDKKAYRCPDCPNRNLIPLTSGIAKAHLQGRDPLCRDVVGIYPLLEDNTVWLLCADFDEENWRDDVSAFRDTCRRYSLIPAVERSRSGNGAHVWFFFSEPVSASDARRLGTALLTDTMSHRHELSFQSYDRLFPTQDSVPKGGFGNLIALPFQGQAQKNNNTLFVDEDFAPYADQWAFLADLPKITPSQLDELLPRLCRSGDLGQLMVADEAEKPWERKRTRKLTEKDFPPWSAITLSNLIYLEKKDYSEAALNAIKRLAAFPNPEFRQKQAMRLPIYQTPRVIDCSYEDSTYIGIPRGCKDALSELLAGGNVAPVYTDIRNMGKGIDVSFRGTLRDEQLPAAEALLKEDIGVLSATTAFGKTVVGAYLIGARKRNTLILVHSSALLEQWQGALSQFLEIHEELPEEPKKRGRKKKRSIIGQIGGGKDTHSGIVDIAIMQSLFEGNEKTVKELVKDYGMVIVDECHHVAAFSFERILKEVIAKYVYGLSATPIRKDGHHPIIFMQCGQIRYLVDAKSQAEKRPFSHYVIPRFTNTRLPDGDGIQDLYRGVTGNESRNKMLIEDTLQLIADGRTPILLTERREHAEQLANMLDGKVKHTLLLVGSDGAKNKREKLAALQDIPQEDDMAIIATGKYIGEGFDSPRLDTLLLAMPISWKGTLAQYAGRLHRNYAGKKEVRIYDYVDIHVPMLERMYHKRVRGYAELGYEVKFGSSADSACTLYSSVNYFATFTQDVADAAKSIVIVCLRLGKGRVAAILSVLQQKVKSGVTVEICTNTPNSDEAAKQIQLLREVGAVVRESDAEIQRYVIVDHNIVWYGNIDVLAFSRNDACAMRFENQDIAGELSDLIHFTGEQLTIQEP